MKQNHGIFISLEGMDFAGKTTQLPVLVKAIEERGYEVLVTREPGGTEVAEAIRRILLDKRENEQVLPLTEVLLFAAARYQHVETKIKPALEKGVVVITDRFHDSSYAYQAYGRGLFREVKQMEDLVLNGFEPHHTLYFSISFDESLQRQGNRRRDSDRLDDETMRFKLDVFRGYERRSIENGHRTFLIPAHGPERDVAARVIDWVQCTIPIKIKQSD